MPRQRQRIVFCDCFDCRDRPEGPSLTPEQLDAATAVARQEPPPKALLIYATGFVLEEDGATNLDSCTLPHCNLVVREGNLGLLAARKSQDAAGLEPAVSELAQLLGVYQDVCRQPLSNSDVAGQTEAGLPSLAARFKGLQGALASTGAPARHLARRLALEVPERLCIGAGEGTGAAAQGGAGAATDAAAPATPPADPPAVTSGPASAAAGAGPTEEAGSGSTAGAASGRVLAGVLPDAVSFAGLVAAELGASEGSSGRDLLVLHLDLDDLLALKAEGSSRGAGSGGDAAAQGARREGEVEASAGAVAVAAGVDTGSGDVRWDAGCEGLEWLDALVKGLLALPEIRERTVLVLMLSPAGHKLPPVPGQGGAVASVPSSSIGGGASSLLHPGGAQLDPAAAVVTPRNLAQLGLISGAGVSGLAAPGAGAAAALAVLDAGDFPLVSRPVQSFEVLGMERVEADVHAPVLVARRLPGVVRRDRAERMAYREALTAGGQGVILLDRLLPEVAYKVGRAPKYGA